MGVLLSKALWMGAACAAFALTGGVATPGSAFAAGFPAVGMVVVAEVDPVAEQMAADRAFVRLIALTDARAIVRASAWNALLSSHGDAAVTEWLATGYAAAVKRASTTTARNADFAKRVLATHTAEYSPEVHAAAQKAVNGTDADRALFAKSGYAAAKERDRIARDAKGELAEAIVQADRDYVRTLSTTDPGAQVRAAAVYALREGAGNAGLVEFFSYDWAQAASVDLEMYRAARVEQELAWRNVNRQLLLDAQAAQLAATNASATEAELARAAAARAWRAVGEQTGPARVAWADAQEHAKAQAANWQQVALAAAAAASENWSVIGDNAATVESAWAEQGRQAAEQAAWWAALLAQAQAGERAMSPAS
jgi:hypothetical protein